jgi:hypothetical protein
MLIVDKMLNDQAQRFVIFHLVQNVVDYTKSPEIQVFCTV